MTNKCFEIFTLKRQCGIHISNQLSFERKEVEKEEKCFGM